MAKDITNLAASVRQRLRNLSLEKQRDFGLVLVNYGLERLIYRVVEFAASRSVRAEGRHARDRLDRR